MAAEEDGYRLYQDLAEWWPLISPPEEYAEEAAFAGQVLRRATRPVREVLELGSGGGHCASHLTPGFTMTLVDATAFAHCRPGGIAVFVPDHITENFEAGTGYGGIDGPDGRGVRYLDWAYDPDPGDTWTLTQYAFLLRDARGEVQVVHETHRLGLFGRATWLRLLREAGFQAAAVTEETTEDRQPREFFTGHRPPGPARDPAGLGGDPLEPPLAYGYGDVTGPGPYR